MLRRIIAPISFSAILLVLLLIVINQSVLSGVSGWNSTIAYLTTGGEENHSEIAAPSIAQKGLSAPSMVISVNTTADVIGNDWHCSLREAIIAANTDTASGASMGECKAGSGADTINLPMGVYSLTLFAGGPDTPAANDLDIQSELSIVGSSIGSSIVDAYLINDRVIEISTAGKATITNLWIQSGGDNGWGGGGISNSGILTLTNSLLIANNSSASGGGLENEETGKANLYNVGFGNNSAGNGAGIENSGIITLSQVSLTFGSAGNSGGGMVNSGIARLSDVNISANTAITDGGGIFNSNTLTLTRVTIDNNEATNGMGGGIWTDGRVSLVNTTLSGNTADHGSGGGFYRGGGDGTLINVTIAENSAFHGGGLYVTAGNFSFQNTLIAKNSSTNCQVDDDTVTSLGNNLSSDLTCNVLFDQPSDQNNVQDAQLKLGPLADNGGKTETHALLKGSVAIDYGSNSGCPSTDQRGFHRPLDGDLDGTATCDIGAFEKSPDIFLPLTLR